MTTPSPDAAGETGPGPAAGESGAVSVALAVIQLRGAVLLIRSPEDSEPRWRFPGGKVEPREKPERAAARETREETGLLVEAGQLIGARIHPQTGRHLIYIACTPAGGTAYRASPREVAEVAWIPRHLALGTYLPGLFEPVHHFLAAP
ncbi:NUDIX hydrolase [Streptomyces sp. NPDC000594]|uniref:NUDIX hydrolase n=1 Tax=Streptomyces sp. NPDC000594 TaxID=3154261 RepID=UPI003318B592